ncbi:tetratricopeptide repeat protein [Streptomyces sp. NPDC006385]|uniref:tetratricopeptide repeat protein n=1 Tax=Streptomyces sp. NPDC006385 TaxID=3156761 RepID=UPI00339F6DAD
MSRLSRAKKREQKRAEAWAASMAAPIDVRVPAVGPGAGGASIGGVPITAAPGEEIQHAVLTHLQRIAVASGHPVHASIHDERIGYVVPLRVDADGSSRFTADPVRTAPPDQPTAPRDDAWPGTGNSTESPAWPVPPAQPVRPPQPVPPVAPVQPVSPAPSVSPESSEPPAAPVPPASSDFPTPPSAPYSDKPTHVLRPLPGPAQDASPTFRLRATPEPVRDAVPGAFPPPLGEFGPPPLMDASPQPGEAPRPDRVVPASQPTPTSCSAPTSRPTSTPTPTPTPATDFDPDPKPTPPRGFDAVAEAVLGDGPSTTAADTSPFAEQMTRINEAVATGRTAEAAELAERTVAEASAVLGPEHAEVLRMRELAAYIAYLAGDAAHAFRLSFDVARTHHRARDAEAAYGSLHGAATAWRAVRDPALGLELGRDLIGLWTDLTAEGGPAAEDIEELESARARMDRLTARAAKSAEPPTG